MAIPYKPRAQVIITAQMMREQQAAIASLKAEAVSLRAETAARLECIRRERATRMAWVKRHTHHVVSEQSVPTASEEFIDWDGVGEAPPGYYEQFPDDE